MVKKHFFLISSIQNFRFESMRDEINFQLLIKLLDYLFSKYPIPISHFDDKKKRSNRNIHTKELKRIQEN